ncbi:hypothetical protein DB032_05100 [Chromobacterium sp. Panama]|uniref:DUF934 domain-containing protein n=1 Tax=Chromobacterium sp. Panama TaxID=2161826 RepID=UPI000D32157D|nr:DUF934 domain-containing protein [Chromobacterium sp. Panama]PTU64330.1 hypothetical protein DB032_05100 [Chromobacterium sp. Panama]
MPNIIKQGQVRPDDWNLLRQDENGQLPETAAGGNVIVPLSDWLERRAFWRSHAARVGVWLGPEDDPARLLVDLPELELIAVDFPAFTDGRGYSHARLLRERYGYRGELRAIGDVWQDLLHSMAQVGFDAFAIKDGKTLESSLDGFNTFSENYQATVLNPLPLFRRRVTSV